MPSCGKHRMQACRKRLLTWTKAILTTQQDHPNSRQMHSPPCLKAQERVLGQVAVPVLGFRMYQTNSTYINLFRTCDNVRETLASLLPRQMATSMQ